MTDAIIRWRRYLKRRNCSPNTVKSYLSAIRSFVLWLDVPIESVTHAKVSHYIDELMRRRLKPKTINCHLNCIRQFYHYLRDEGLLEIANPVRNNHALKMSRPLPRHLRDEQVESFFQAVQRPRDRAMFMLMLRCGLRVEEVAHLSLGVLDFKHRKLLIEDGKGGKDRIVYMSHDALRPWSITCGSGLLAEPDRSSWLRRALHWPAHLDSRHPEAHGVLCAQNQAPRFLSSSAAHDGHAASQCRCRSVHDPGSSRAQQRQDHAALLQGLNLKVQRDYFNAMEVIMRQRLASRIALDEQEK